MIGEESFLLMGKCDTRALKKSRSENGAGFFVRDVCFIIQFSCPRNFRLSFDGFHRRKENDVAN